jgi:hypothetical protein
VTTSTILEFCAECFRSGGCELRGDSPRSRDPASHYESVAAPSTSAYVARMSSRTVPCALVLTNRRDTRRDVRRRGEGGLRRCRRPSRKSSCTKVLGIRREAGHSRGGSRTKLSTLPASCSRTSGSSSRTCACPVARSCGSTTNGARPSSGSIESDDTVRILLFKGGQSFANDRSLLTLCAGIP